MKKTMTQTSYFVLASLVNGPKHGYAIVKAAAELSGDSQTMPVATVYFTLDKLATLDLIEQISEQIVDGRARRVFAITVAGTGLVELETQRLAEAAAAVAKQLAAARKLAVKPARAVRPSQARSGATA